MSLRNIDPVLWGPSAWSLLHTLSFHSKSSVETLQTLFESLKILLPCAVCRANYKSHLEALAFPTKRSEVALWLYKLHDRVNRSNGHSSSPSFATVRKRWETDGIETALRDSWRFLFLLALAYPPRHSSFRQLRVQYREALGLWMKEIANTLWHSDPRDSSTQSRTRFTQWLKNKYVLLNGGSVPKSLLTVSVACDNVCHVKHGT